MYEDQAPITAHLDLSSSAQVSRAPTFFHTRPDSSQWPPSLGFGICYALGVKCPPEAPVFEHLMPSRWHCGEGVEPLGGGAYLAGGNRLLVGGPFGGYKLGCF